MRINHSLLPRSLNCSTCALCSSSKFLEAFEIIDGRDWAHSQPSYPRVILGSITRMREISILRFLKRGWVSNITTFFLSLSPKWKVFPVQWKGFQFILIIHIIYIITTGWPIKNGTIDMFTLLWSTVILLLDTLTPRSSNLLRTYGQHHLSLIVPRNSGNRANPENDSP